MRVKVDYGTVDETSIRLDKLLKITQSILSRYPDAVAVLNQRNLCLDVYRVINNGGETELVNQILVE